MIKFKFSKDDYYNIPGLSRPWDNDNMPYLAPVFFEKNCLGKYFVNPEYRCSSNETYGTIDHDKFNIPFGINKNKKIIMWLGDLEKLPKNEQLYLSSFNIDSDHDIASQFYDAQINGEFPDSIKEVEMLMQKAKINKIFYKKFGFNLFKEVFQDNDMDEVLKQVEKYSKIIMNQKEHFESYIREWNDILIKDIQKDELIQFLQSEKIETKDKDGKNLGEIKLFEKLIQEKIAKDNIILPYYVLSDLRIWAAHKGCKTQFNDSLKRLSLSESKANDYELIYKTLIGKIIEFHNRILIWGVCLGVD